MKIVKYIQENWETLPKSSFNDMQIVIFKETDNYDGGWGHHSYGGYGVNEQGELCWCYSSGCSCCGSSSVDSNTEKTLKMFTLDEGSIEDVEPESVNFAGLVVSYSDY